MYPYMNYVGEKPADVLTLDLYPKGTTSFTLYEDDGVTRDYQKGEFAETLITMSATAPAGEATTAPVTVKVAKAQGDYKGRYAERAYILDMRYAASPKTVTLNGQALPALSAEAYGAGQTGWYFDAADRTGRLKVQTAKLSTDSDQTIVVTP